DEANQHCAPGEVGTLVHRGPTVAMGYWNNEAETNRVYRPNPFLPAAAQGVERVVYSGDLVTKDAEGFRYFVGRRDEQIKVEGYRISPQEIEELLYALPGIKEAVAFGIPEPAVGHRIVAVISLTAPASCTEIEIREHFRRNAPQYMTPKVIEFWEE